MPGSSVDAGPPHGALRLSLIRDFALRNHGRPVTVAPASQRLVSFVALQDRPVRRSVISGTLWGGSDEQHASGSLRSALWRLPRLDLIRTSPTHIWLSPAVEVDLRRVIEEARGLLRGLASTSTLDEVARDLIDVGDDILLGWYEDWVQIEREQFRQIRLQALDRIAEQLLEAGSLFAAFQVALAATRTEPLRESSQRLLVRVHLTRGNVAEALHQYWRFTTLLRSEVDGRPSPMFEGLIAPYLRRL